MSRICPKCGKEQLMQKWNVDEILIADVQWSDSLIFVPYCPEPCQDSVVIMVDAKTEEEAWEKLADGF